MRLSGAPAQERGLVHFLHGKESGPWGRKIGALAAVASARGWNVESLDYSHTTDPSERLDLLLRSRPRAGQRLVLAGSSMGGWVAAQAAQALQAQGVFLLAPALYLPGYPAACPVPAPQLEIVHGWDDEVIPFEHSVRYAHQHRCKLHLVAGDHRLAGDLPLLGQLFDGFLARCEGSP